MKLILKLIILFLPVIISAEEYYVRDVYIENNNVFSDSSAFNRFLNWFHIPTRKYIIEDEMLFDGDQELDQFSVYETERILRNTGLFTDVEMVYDTVGYNLIDITIKTVDRWSLSPALLYGNEGGVTELGFLLSEANLFGRNYDVEFEVLDRTENDIGNQGRIEVGKRRIYRQNLDLYFNLVSNKFKTTQQLDLTRPYRDFFSAYSYGLMMNNDFGQDFIYELNSNEFDLLKVHERRARAYFSKSWVDKDRAFASVLVEYNNIDRGLPERRRAFDNSAMILMQVSSVSERFEKTNRLNLFKDEDIQIGGYGSAILGRTLSINGEGDQLWYIGGRGERSYYDGNWYFYARVMGGSGFARSKAQYTFQEFTGLGFYKFSNKLLLATQLQQQTAWTWTADRQLILDPTTGLRGFNANAFAGDSRIISNTELRFFPNARFWLFDFSTAAFFDIGTVWNQDTGFENAQWKKSVGLGFRIHNKISTGENSIFRFDFAWNLDENRFGGIIFTTDHLFYVFKRHRYRIPQIMGLDFDDE